MRFCLLWIFALLYSIASSRGAFATPRTQGSVAISPKPSPFYLQPTFFEGPLESEGSFWAQREQKCIQEVQEQWGVPDENTPAAQFVQDAAFTNPQESFLKQTFGEQTISLHSERCTSTLPRDQQRVSLHVFWKTPDGLYVLPGFATDNEYVRESKEYRLLEMSLRDQIPGEPPRMILRFSITALDQTAGTNSLLQQETEFLLLFGKGVSQTPSAIPPIPVRIARTQTRELLYEPGPPTKHSEAQAFYHLLPTGNLSLTFPKRNLLFSSTVHPPSGVHLIVFP